MRLFLFILIFASCAATIEPPVSGVQASAELCGEACDALRSRLHPEGSTEKGCPFADGIPTEDGKAVTCVAF